MTEALQTAIDAALAAGKILKERRDNFGTIKYKGEIDPVTEVDLQCEKEIIDMISSRFPDHGFLAEESNKSRNLSSEYQWIIDPLDGTVNFAHGYPCYCTSIGLEVNGQVELGVVYNPSLDELFVAEKGKGAFLNSKPIKVSSISNLKQSMLVTGFAYDVSHANNNNLDHFENFLKSCQAVRRPGSAALDLCYTAMGRFEGFWEIKLHPWDMAAGKLLLEEAGGKLSLFDGSDFDLYKRQIVATNGMVHDAMLDILKKGKPAEVMS
jgi:myo-inositol-1(or 4)-monophosphatase